MQPNSNNSQFEFVLPTDFVPDVLEYKYRKHLQNYHLPYDTVVDYLSSTIKEIDFPSITFPTVEQTTQYGKKITYRGSISPYDVYSNKFSVSFRSVNNFANYFIIRDCLFYHYINPKSIFVQPFMIYVLDAYFRESFSYVFKEVIPLTLSNINFSYPEQGNQEKLFSMSAAYNFLEIQYLLKDKPQLPPKKHL